MKKTGKFITLLFTFVLFLANSAFGSEVKFIHITDIALKPENSKRLSETIKEINQYPDIDFVVIGGNNIAKAKIDNLNTFLYLLGKIKKKTVVLLGSSDLYASCGIDKKYYMKHVKLARLKHLKYQTSKTNYTFSKKGYRFIVMDGSKQYFQTTNGYYSKKETTWLDKQLKKYKNKNVIILQHFPLLEANSAWIDTQKKDEYFDVLKKHNNVKLIVSGHYGYNREIKKDGIYHIITEDYSKNGAYKIIHLDLKDNFIGTYLVK